MKVVIVGHVDHGKSTLIGRLLYDSGSLPESRLSEMQTMAEEYKKKFEFAYFMDAFADEVKEERTIDTTEVFFKGEHLHTLIDVPGHREFIEAMLTGASHAEAAIVVVDATKGLEEQTRRHLNLIELLGIDTIILVINKMDLVDYKPLELLRLAQDDFIVSNNLIKAFVPISAAEGENVYTRTSKMGWYTGGSLVEEIDKLQRESRIRPDRFIVQGVYKGETLGSGTIPLDRVKEFSPSEVPQRGCVGSTSKLRPAEAIWAKVFILDSKVKRLDSLLLRCGTGEATCKISSINRRINSETGLDTGGSTLKRHDLGVIVLDTAPIVVDRFEDYPPLGRFTLRRNGRDIAVGVVLDYE